ncbi:MAG TPA: pyruvate ferredoxin oxidoreductase [Candidatus Ratteibacteria bacterium]|nr:pyruvate ferredoxin oxidoreductase [bacterium]HRS06218.1 pyruvate ferredoxin oxidoreductase [Candidatus Ratteibacteria bacterium]HOL49896.1 pyruvate ferredoxin oxidoreductase [bacterium]HPC30167.1 pyruvate ferredoxin oxidoreductase [bacterium]HPO52700.1 pyruvate ferredoxin oxidoreductase [bacterium]
MPSLKKVTKTGNEVFAEAMRQINPDVVAAYPITPATEIVQIFSQFVADGLVKTEYIAVESEHSAMSACIGSSAAGARTMTGTSAQGLALMWEMLYIAAGLKLPIIMAVVNRALSAPINIHCDHSDTMGARDSGWIQIYSENVQEAYDNLIQAVRIAEHPDVRLPVMATTDGFILSHCLEVAEILNDSDVQSFVGIPPERPTVLDFDKPITLGALDLQDYYFEHRRQIAEAMTRSIKVINDIADKYAKLSGRKYEFFEKYQLDDAEYAIVLIGSTAGTAKDVVDKLRSQGKKVGLLKIRVFRPFDYMKVRQTLENIKVIGVMDRADGLNAYCGPLYTEICTSLYESEKKPALANYIYGLGGREVKEQDIETIFDDLFKIGKEGKTVTTKYIGVR